MMEIMEEENKIYKLLPNHSLGEFVFFTNIQKYLSNRKYEITSNEDTIIGTWYSFVDPDITVFIDSKNIIESIKCTHKCYVYGVNVISLNIDYVIKEVIKIEPDFVESLWTYHRDKEVKQRVFDFDTIGLQVWTYRSKVVSVTCSSFDETTGPSGT
jgi:hypothetical protein